MSEKFTRTFTAAFFTMSAKALGMLLAFIVQVLVARQLGVDEAGAFFYGANALLLLSIVAGMGMEVLLLRFVANAFQEREKIKAEKKFVECSAVASLGTASVMIIGFAAIWTGQINKLGASAKPEVITWVLVTLPGQVLLYLASEYHRGRQSIGRSQFIRFSVVPVIFLVAWLGMRPVTAASTMSLYAASVWLCAIWALLSLRFNFADRLKLVARENITKVFLAGLPLYWTALSAGFANIAPVLAVGRWCSPSDVSRFHVAFQLTALVGVVLHSFNAIVAPKIAYFNSAGRNFELENYVRKVTLLMSVIALPPVVLLVVFPGFFLSFFGPEFQTGGGLVQIMAIAQFFNVISGPVGFILIMTGNERAMRNTVVLTTVFAILALIISVPTFGALGAAVAFSITLILNNLILSFVVWRLRRVVVFPFMPNMSSK